MATSIQPTETTRPSDVDVLRGARDSGADIIPGADDFDTSAGPGPEVMDAATLIGDEVVNAQGDDLGKIEAIMLDVRSGRIAYAVLSFGGFLGFGSKLFAIPWNALTLDAKEERLVLNVSKEKLENAEGFDKDNWPAMADTEWATKIHAYYEVAPYWNDQLRGKDDARTIRAYHDAPAASLVASDRE
jgi:sporulation protein YlmC with PRC-barrel domain